MPSKNTVSNTQLSAEARAAAYYEARAAAANAKARLRPTSASSAPWGQEAEDTQAGYSVNMTDGEQAPMEYPRQPPPQDHPQQRQWQQQLQPNQTPLRDSPRAKWGAAVVPEAWVDQRYSPSSYSDPSQQGLDYYPGDFEPSPAPSSHLEQPSPPLEPLQNEPPTPTSQLQLTECLDREMKELKLRVAELSRRAPFQESQELEVTQPLAERVVASMQQTDQPPQTPPRREAWRGEVATPGWRGSVLMPDTPTSVDDGGTPMSPGWSSQIETEIAEGLDREIAELKLRVSELSKRANLTADGEEDGGSVELTVVAEPGQQVPVSTEAQEIAAARELIGPQMDEGLFARCLAEAQSDFEQALDYYAQCQEHQLRQRQHQADQEEKRTQDAQRAREHEQQLLRAQQQAQQQRAEHEQQQRVLEEQQRAALHEQAQRAAAQEVRAAAQEVRAAAQEQGRLQQERQEQELGQTEVYQPEQVGSGRKQRPSTAPQRPSRGSAAQTNQPKHPCTESTAPQQQQFPVTTVNGMTPAVAAKVAAVQGREDRRRETLRRAAAIRDERRRARELESRRSSTAPENSSATENSLEDRPIHPISKIRNSSDDPAPVPKNSNQPAAEFETEFVPQSKFAGFGKPPAIKTKDKRGQQAKGTRRKAAPAGGRRVAGARRHSLPGSPTSDKPGEKVGGESAENQRPLPKPAVVGSTGGPRRAQHKRTSSRDDGVSTRINFDKRTSRHKNASHFASAVQRYRQRRDPEKMVTAQRGRSNRGCVVCVRKRPLFDYEAAKGEFDCITVYPIKGHCVVHNCQMQADMYRMFIKHEDFVANASFDEHAATETVYADCAASLVELSISGGIATIFMYGQTGSGKTYTMKGLQRMAAEHIFAAVAGGRIVMSFFEIAGKALADLIEPEGCVELRQDADGIMQVCGAAQVEVANPGEMLTVLEAGEARRATHGTDVNSVSSRSHSVLRLELSTGGTLLLIDCAGSERKEDSMMHSAERRREGAQINSSLHALKECFRAMREGNPHVPFRGSQLTKVLQESFTREDALTMVLATLSPTPTDIEHSISTLRTVTMLGGTDGLRTEIKEDVPTSIRKR